jgi:hypothetical protein
MPDPSPSAPPAPDPGARLFQALQGYKASAGLHIATRLGIADLLAGGPKPVSELARASATNENALYRLLRALASMGAFSEVAPGSFANTPVSELLRRDAPGSMRDAVLWIADPFHFRLYAEFLHSIRTGETTIRKMTGHGAFEYFDNDPALGAVFHSAMTAISAMALPAVLEAYDFGDSGTLCDVAGGHGLLLTGILRKHAGLRGILFDLPGVVEGARPRIDSLGLASRCEVVGGDFFGSVPAADRYVLKNIIHDWDDEHAARILDNCRRAMHGDGRIVLLEQVIAPGDVPQPAKWLDLDMLALAGGRERTAAEFGELVGQAGLRLARIVPTRSPYCVIEAVKA